MAIPDQLEPPPPEWDEPFKVLAHECGFKAPYLKPLAFYKGITVKH
jgi:hypothetical protein